VASAWSPGFPTPPLGSEGLPSSVAAAAMPSFPPALRGCRRAITESTTFDLPWTSGTSTTREGSSRGSRWPRRRRPWAGAVASPSTSTSRSPEPSPLSSRTTGKRSVSWTRTERGSSATRSSSRPMRGAKRSLRGWRGSRVKTSVGFVCSWTTAMPSTRFGSIRSRRVRHGPRKATRRGRTSAPRSPPQGT
jgi:hypothetical protein